MGSQSQTDSESQISSRIGVEGYSLLVEHHRKEKAQS